MRYTIILVLGAALGFASCGKKTEEPDLTTPYLGTWTYNYKRLGPTTSISQTGTMEITKKSNNSVLIPFSEGKGRTFSISSSSLKQDMQTVLLSEIQGGIYATYSFTEESTGVLSGSVINISGAAQRSDSKAYTFTVQATRR